MDTKKLERKANRACPLVLFYPTGIVHFRNLEIIKKILPNFEFIIIVESWVKEKAPEVLSKIQKEDLAVVKNGQLPGEVWEKPVNILFLSMAYPNQFRLHLVYEATQRNIPVMAVEEVNQLALNNGIINHYFLPIDYFGVPSSVEKEKFMELGMQEASIKVTGWPFFEKEAHAKNHYNANIKKQYDIPRHQKCCLLVLGSLKEHDIASLETRKIRREILEIVSRGLTENYQLLIKPHPIETEEALQDIRKQVPDAILLDPKDPIEPLLAQSDLVVNRGNSQVTLLAMLQSKPLIVVPTGLKTIFQKSMDSIIANSASGFNRILKAYTSEKKVSYIKILDVHFPFTQKRALFRVRELFQEALKKRKIVNNNKKFYISILYAFLRNIGRAKEIVSELPEDETVFLLKKLFNKQIGVDEFKTLLEYFPGKIIRWHLQALFIRSITEGKARYDLSITIPLLENFDGDVNPHYFMGDIVKRIELEYRAGNQKISEKLAKKFYDGYSVFDYFKQAFDMLRFVYHNHRKYLSLRKTLWLLMNLNTPYSRKFIKNKLKKREKVI